MKAKRQFDAAHQLKVSNAASVVDGLAWQARLYLVANVGNGWLCEYQLMRDVDKTVLTSRAGSPLSGPKVLYETRNVTTTQNVGEIRMAMIFGMPDYNRMQSDARGRRTWSGFIYPVGYYSEDGNIESKDNIQAFQMDRFQAIRLVAENGFDAIYTKLGEPIQKSSPEKVINSTGTSFAVTDNGILATAAHVIKDASSVMVYVNGSPKTAQILAIDQPNDLALLKVEGLSTKGLRLVIADDLTLGASLFVVGFPLSDLLGTNVKLTKGNLSSIAKEGDDKSAFQMSVPVQPGNSGGPVCDVSGNVVGVVRAQFIGKRIQNVNQATRAELLVKLCSSIPDVHMSQRADAMIPAEKRVADSTFLVSVTSKQE